MDDLELLRRYTEHHSEDAFRTLVDRHLPMVFSVAMRVLRDQQLSEEIAQNAFKKLAEASQRGSVHVIGGWLYNTTRNLALNALRSERRRRERETIASSMQVSEFSNLPFLEDLDAVMAELEPDDRDLLVLRFLEGRTLREVGEELAVSEEAARKRVTRALDRLRERFELRGSVLSATALGTALCTANLAVPSELTAAIINGLCGQAATTTAGITALNTLQKVLLATALVAVVGLGLYETRRSVRLRKDIVVLQRQRSDLGLQLDDTIRQLEEARLQLAAAQNQNQLLQQNSSELLRLRNEVGMLRRERLAGDSSFGGKSIIEWLREYDPKTRDLTDEAKNAIRKIGPAGVPDLLSALLSSKVGYNEQTSSPTNITPWNVTCAFKVLGPLGKQAVPTLVQYLTSGEEWLRLQAAASLGFIGPEARIAIPELLQSVKDQESDPVRVNSIGALVRIGGDRSLLLPVFESSLRDRSSTVRDWAATGIGKFGADGAEAIPALIEALARHDEEARVQSQELKAIEEIGPTTNDIAPRIQSFLRHPNWGVRMAATNALSRVAPQLFPASTSN